MSIVWVFFAASRKRRRRTPVKAIVRSLIRKRGRGYEMLLSLLVRWFSGSPLIHVAVGDGRVVLDPGIRGNHFWEATAFALHYPSLAWCIEFIPERPLELAGYECRGPKRAWPSFIRWLTRGLWPANDCVTTVIHALRHAGEPVPLQVVTPQDLFDWLRGRGHTLIDMDDT